MALPRIKAPAGTPRFRLDGYSMEEDSVFSGVQFTTGHSRSRRRWTVSERVVQVSWFLSAQQLLAIDYWYQTTLRAGALEFAAEVLHLGPGVRWWTARWISFQAEMRNGNRGVVSGSILLTGSPSLTPPSGSDMQLAVRASLLGIPKNVAIAKRLRLSVSAALISPVRVKLHVTAALQSE